MSLVCLKVSATYLGIRLLRISICFLVFLSSFFSNSAIFLNFVSYFYLIVLMALSVLTLIFSLSYLA